MENMAAAPGFGSPEGPDAVAVRAAENVLAAAAELTDIEPAALSADALLEFTGLLGNIARLVEGRQVGNVGDIARRSDTDAGFSGLAARHGCSSPAALFEKITGSKNSTAYRYTKLATHTTPRVSDTGLPLDPVFPQTAQALSDGVIGLDAAEAITTTLAPVLPRAVPEQMDWAEATLLGNATGANGEAPVSADNLRQQARAFCAVLDPDGVEPSAEELHQARKLVFRHQDDGTLKITGTLSPEQAAQVTPVFDAYMSKRTSPTFMHADEQADNEQAPEERSKPQERADVFTTIIGGTGKQKTAPKLHGRGPTVLVTVDERNLNNSAGAAWSPGTPAALPTSFVKQMQCDGDTRHVQINEHGEVLDLGHASREFSPEATPRPDRTRRQHLRRPRLPDPRMAVRSTPHSRMENRRQNRPVQRRPTVLVAPPRCRTRRMGYHPRQQRPTTRHIARLVYQQTLYGTARSNQKRYDCGRARDKRGRDRDERSPARDQRNETGDECAQRHNHQ